MTAPATNLLERLHARLTESEAQLDSIHVVVLRRQTALVALLDAEQRRLEADREQRALTTLEDLRERVVSLVQRNLFDQLSPREARAGARMIGPIAAPQLAALIRARPEVASVFVEEFFRSWDIVGTMPTRSSLSLIHI